MAPTRREFLAAGLSGATLLATGPVLPGFLARTARAASSQNDERILVVVQLTGGNDGLNTVIPFEDDRYHRLRPTLRIGPQRVLKLNDTLGLHPEMAAFQRMYDDGLLSVVTNVGYPNPNRSHFASMDIWHCAQTGLQRCETGWLGRVVDRRASAGDAPFALHLDYEALPLALKTENQAVPSITNLDAFRLRGEADSLTHLLNASQEAPAVLDAAALDALRFVQRTAVASCANARRLEQIRTEQTMRAEYPGYGLARRLQQIAELIGADFGPRIFYTSLGGFDTHARQTLAHGPLLRELSESVAAFFDDLRARGRDRHVVLMTFSEFGRRVAENGSQGTDHGAAAPMFLAGPACRPGVLGSAPDLANLAEGDVRFERDFRTIYAAVLRDWLMIDPKEILGQPFEPARIF
ncbi:MAG: DUF1501 domain-containing protein [Planctomycetota bacterium]|nr:MAG: DUF1501 domain-containing protein [Planctomycetota bacterium]